MKKLIVSLTIAALAACPLAGFAQTDLQHDPACLPIDKVLDLKAIPPQVDVNLPRFLLKDALSSLSSTNPENAGADLADLVKDVKAIRVLVFENTQSNRAAMDKSVAMLQSELNTKWTALVKVADEGSKVGIYVIGDPSGDSVAGVAVLVHDGNDTVIANVVGHVSLGKLVKFASQSNKLPKDLMKQLASAGLLPAEQYSSGHAGTKTLGSKKKTSGDAATDRPQDASENAEAQPDSK